MDFLRKVARPNPPQESVASRISQPGTEGSTQLSENSQPSTSKRQKTMPPQQHIMDLDVKMSEFLDSRLSQQTDPPILSFFKVKMSLPNSRSLALKEIIKDLQKNSSTNIEVEKENLLPVSPTDQKEPIENQVVPSTSKRNIPLNERAYNVHQSLRDKGSSYSSDQKSDQDFSPASDDDREYIPPSIADSSSSDDDFKRQNKQKQHKTYLSQPIKSLEETKCPIKSVSSRSTSMSSSSNTSKSNSNTSSDSSSSDSESDSSKYSEDYTSHFNEVSSIESNMNTNNISGHFPHSENLLNTSPSALNLSTEISTDVRKFHNSNEPLPLKVLAQKIVTSLITHQQSYLSASRSAECQNSNSSPKKTRKRKRGINKKALAKTLRNLGQSYTSTSNVVKSCRKIGNPCGDGCRQKCKERISEEQRQIIFKRYWSMGSLVKQREFISRHIREIKPKYQYKKIDSNRKPKHSFYFTIDGEKIKVCKVFFKNTLGLNDRPIRTVIEKLNSSGIVEPELRGKHNKHRQVVCLDVTHVKEKIHIIIRFTHSQKILKFNKNG
ncbi:unnamed protein product [Parnassius apollo]|uniref:(apollo) hypothetical protein n=1 Tax=Parnassius apollo TaxID=110799 RepID=A0A8S3XNK6_PARAO|nr:unnamed protein product [Parnassius apollo]